MIFLSSNPTFGELQDRETFVFYDRPILFTASNAAGHLYLVNWLGEIHGVDQWLVVAISATRLEAAKSGRISLTDLFVNPQTGSVWRLATGLKGEFIESRVLSPQEISRDDLPIAGTLLISDATLLQKGATEVSASELARDIILPVVYLKLYPHSDKHDAPARELGEMLSSLQDVISAQSPKWHRVRPTKKRGLPANVLLTTGPQLRVLGTFPSSFGLKLALISNDSDPEQYSAFSSTVDLISAAGDIENLELELSERSKKTTSALTRFFKSVSDTDSPLEVEAASPQQTEGTLVQLAASDIRQAYRVLREQTSKEVQERTIQAELIGINVRSRTFEIRDIKTGQSIKGKIGREIFNQFEKASVPDRYRIVVEERTSRTPIGQVKTAWVLVNATKLR